MVAISGGRPVDGALFYGNNRDYENTLLEVRSRMLEGQGIRTRQTYHVTARNFGNVDEEMFAEQNSNVTTPSANANYIDPDGAGPLGVGQYLNAQGTPMFLEQEFANNDRFVGLSAVGSNASVINVGTNNRDLYSDIHVGETIQINGELRRVSAFVAPTANSPGTISVSSPFSVAPTIGAQILLKGRDYVNPHLNETYRVTDKYGSKIVDSNRFQVDRDTGVIRYRPSTATQDTDSIWHPENLANTPYYFGKLITVKTPPPAAGPTTDGIGGNEDLGAPADPVPSGSAPGVTPVVAPQAPPTNAGQLVAPFITAYNPPLPDGEFSNIRVTTPAGVAYTVELNGAVLAVVSSGGTVTIPFFDPNPQNDQLKANESTDPDIYIQRFVKSGNNELVIKATRTGVTAATGVKVEGLFNGVSLQTGADTLTGTGKLAAYNSVMTTDWSTSRNSVLGIVGKTDFELGDQVALEDANDEVEKIQGVLESLTTIIAGTDINALTSILSVIK